MKLEKIKFILKKKRIQMLNMPKPLAIVANCRMPVVFENCLHYLKTTSSIKEPIGKLNILALFTPPKAPIRIQKEDKS